MLRKPHSLDDLQHHKKSIHILISQAYHINRKGEVLGFIDPNLLAFTKKDNIKLMAMVTNTNFDKNSSHEFLTHIEAQKKALSSLLEICKKHNFYGIQFDLEMISFKDKKALTSFYQTAANLFHKHGYRVSFAVIPAITEGPFKSVYQKRLYENLSGAYDLSILAKSADFITLMAYDQHIGNITPGSVASVPWVESVIQHALKFIPHHKLSLGIPTYSGFWYTGVSSDKKIRIHHNSIGYDVVSHLVKKHHALLKWDDIAKGHYTFYQKDWLNQFIFIEDAKSFKEKLKLVKKYHLRGISVFRLGVEDPKVWDTI